MDDDDPKAYKPAPGDKEAKTKPSVHTKKYKQMFGEAVRADTKVRKRPHMALEKTGAVKFDKRFKIFKNKEYVNEDMQDEILDFAKSFDDFLISEDFNQLIESKEALKKKAEKTGISYSILKKVFDRGVAAWRTGHRPGTNPTQWGLARVNSFVTKGKGTWGKADKDLADKVRKEQFSLTDKEKKELLSLDEQTMLNKVLEKIHNHVTKGESLMDVLNQITTLSNVGISSRTLETEYKKKYGEPNTKTNSSLKTKNLLKKYGYKSEQNENTPFEREQGTDSLTKKYKKDTPGQVDINQKNSISEND